MRNLIQLQRSSVQLAQPSASQAHLKRISVRFSAAQCRAQPSASQAHLERISVQLSAAQCSWRSPAHYKRITSASQCEAQRSSSAAQAQVKEISASQAHPQAHLKRISVESLIQSSLCVVCVPYAFSRERCLCFGSAGVSGLSALSLRLLCVFVR